MATTGMAMVTVREATLATISHGSRFGRGRPHMSQREPLSAIDFLAVAGDTLRGRKLRDILRTQDVYA
jgi:hypothetical protein